MVEGLRLYEHLEALKRKLRIIETRCSGDYTAACVEIERCLYIWTHDMALLLTPKLIRRVMYNVINIATRHSQFFKYWLI